MQLTSCLLATLYLAMSASARPQEIVTEPPAEPAFTPIPCALRDEMPECGIPCIIQAANAVGCTRPQDHACHCAHDAEMQAAVRPCVLEACGPVTGPLVGSVANAICSVCVSGVPGPEATPAP